MMPRTAILVAMVLSIGGSQPPQAEDSLYSPAQIDELISSGAATSYGAQFENQGLGCRTFLWPEANDHQVFFFRRDGKTFGEYRDETLQNQRFRRIEEMYLTTAAASQPAKGPLPFVRKRTTYNWEHDVWVGSRVQWTLLLRDPDGKVTTKLKEGNEALAKATATVVVPPEQMSKDREYYLAIYKRIPSQFDKAFYSRIEEGRGLPLWRGRVVEGRCEVRAEWPVRDPDLLFVLLERIPNPPVDATPMMVRTGSIATMRRTSTITQAEIIRFVPDGK